MFDTIWDRIDKDRFLMGFKISILVYIIIGLIFSIIWYLIVGQIFNFPLNLYSLGFGGLILTISGCIGPGRYRKKHELLIYEPESGSSYSENIPVTGFLVDDKDKKADVVVNGQKVSKIDFKGYFGETTLKRSDFIDSPVNKIWLEIDGVKSNENYFSTFNYDEDMTDEEIDELIEMDQHRASKPIKKARESYIDKIRSGIGSIALGIAFASVIVFAIGFVFDVLILQLA